MDAPDFDFDEVFDSDYLFFYGALLTDERTDADVAAIIELMELEPGAEILDLACGHGRIANRLAAGGYRVTGLDTSELFLDEARKDAASRGVDVEYVHGDMRWLPRRDRFDAVVNWFTAWGYFSDEQNLAVLREIADALRPGGVFLMDTLNRDWVVKNMQHDSVVERDGAFVLDTRELDYQTGFITTRRVVIKDGRTRRFSFSVRTFTIPEMRGWLADAGFANAEFFSGRGEPYSPDVNRLVVRARR